MNTNTQGCYVTESVMTASGTVPGKVIAGPLSEAEARKLAFTLKLNGKAVGVFVPEEV